MAARFFTQRFKANSDTLKRVISDESAELPEFKEKKASGGASILVLSQPLKEEETVGDNAFKEVGESLGLKPANTTGKPEVSPHRLAEMAETAVTDMLADMAPDMIQRIIEEMAPVRVANIFAERGYEHVGHAVEAYAPQQIEELTEKIAPQIVASVAQATVESQLKEHMEEILPGGIEQSVARIVKEEMQGAFGYTVTRRIKALIQQEIGAILKR